MRRMRRQTESRMTTALVGSPGICARKTIVTDSAANTEVAIIRTSRAGER
jgi:hypothetical protein